MYVRHGRIRISKKYKIERLKEKGRKWKTKVRERKKGEERATERTVGTLLD